MAHPSRAESPLRKAWKTLSEGRKLLASRQKLILLADRSEYGWVVARRYEADELAVDSDNEKKIRKAEKEAQDKLERLRTSLETVEKADSISARQLASLTGKIITMSLAVGQD